MLIFCCYKLVIVKVYGFVVVGGFDIVLCVDMVIMVEDV